MTALRLLLSQQEHDAGLNNTAARPSSSASYQTANPQQLQAAGIQPLVKGPSAHRFNNTQVT